MYKNPPRSVIEARHSSTKVVSRNVKFCVINYVVDRYSGMTVPAAPAPKKDFPFYKMWTEGKTVLLRAIEE